MLKKCLFTVSLFFALIPGALAQPWANQSMLSTQQLKKKKLNFYDLQENFNRYWQNKKANSIEESENIEEGGYQQFKRLEWFLKPRVYPTGEFNSEALYTEYIRFKSENQNRISPSTSVANWTMIGPDVVPGNAGGLGRINCMAFYPNQPDTLFAGAACGGLWRSNDGGNTWSSNTDLLPSLSISEIVINPLNPDTMYLATGDKYGIYFQYEVTGHYSAGILISTDGGLTWNQTSMNYTQAQNILFQRLIINPINPSILIVATSGGIYRSIDAGTTWNLVQAGGMFYDVEFNATSPSTIYAVDGTDFYRSTDDGFTWAQYGNIPNMSGDRTSIAVTSANANAIYVWDNGGTLYYSNNGGLSFTAKTTPNCTPYGYYDNVIAVSPVNDQVLFAGGLNASTSNNGGNTWNVVSDWNGWPNPNYSHADHHAIEFYPGSSTRVFGCNDGGIFETTNSGASWTDRTGGISISQFYRFANDQTNPYLIYAGAQDNGTDKYDGTTWNRVMGADGMECMIDYNNPLIAYVSTQGGPMHITTDGGQNFSDITPCYGDWTTPFAMHPVNSSTIYSACTDVWESTNSGSSWTPLPGPGCPENLFSLKLCESNPNYIYTASVSHIYKTTNHGVSWTEITAGLPVSSAAITMIAVKDINPDEVWVTFSGYSSGNKVYYTNNGGVTWINVSGTLPNIPVNCIVYQNNSNDIVYAGTDFGVFYTDNTLNDWVAYNTGLPNVIVDELEIQYTISKLRAATYGRGVWESDLTTSVLFQTDVGVQAIISPQGNYCDSVINAIARIRNYGIDTITSFTLSYYFDANPAQTLPWTGVLPPLSTVDIPLPQTILSPGGHTFTSSTSLPNGVSDLNTVNDIRTSNFNIKTLGIPTPVTEGYEIGGFPPGNWTLQNSGGLLSLYTGTGGFGASAHCMMANYYNITSGTAYFISPEFNLLNTIAPAQIAFDVAYREYSNLYHDSLFVSISSDCGATYMQVYSKGDGVLATTTPSTNYFIPLASEWRRDSIDISSYIGSPNLLVRFETKSGFGNNLFIDNINILTNGFVGNNSISIKSDEIYVYPNPSSNIFNLNFKPSGENYKIKVFNGLGEQVWYKDKAAASGYEVIDLRKQASGIYYIEISGNSSPKIMKLSLMH